MLSVVSDCRYNAGWNKGSKLPWSKEGKIRLIHW